jgi:WD40 repeat protein
LFVSSLNGAANADNTGELDPLESRDGSANQMAFSSDGRWAVVAAADRSVRYRDVEGRRDLKRFVGHTASVWSVALSADGKLAISGSMDGTARVWEVASAHEIRKYSEHTGLVSAVGFNPNGRWGFSGGYDGVLAAWKVATGQEVWRLENLGLVTALAVDPKGSYLFAAAGGMVYVLDQGTGKTVRRHGPFPATVASLGTSPNGEWYAAGLDDGAVRVWQRDEEKERQVLSGHDGPVRSVAVKDGGRWLLTAGVDRTVRLWDTSQPQKQDVAVFTKHSSPAIAAAFLANGTQILSGDRDVTILPWSIERFLSIPSMTPEKSKGPASVPDTIPLAKPN